MQPKIAVENNIKSRLLKGFDLPKGKSYLKEIEKAKKLWNFSYKVVNNNHLLDKSGGVTLEIVNLKKIK